MNKLRTGGVVEEGRKVPVGLFVDSSEASLVKLNITYSTPAHRPARPHIGRV